MNNCLILLLLLFCCGNQDGPDDFRQPRRRPCGERDNKEDSCGGRRETRNDGGIGRDTRNDCGCGRDSRNIDSGMERERGFSTFPSPGGTCGCEEKE